MRKSTLLLNIFFTVLCTSAVAQTNFSGGIFSNTTWTVANSPYIITGSVVVFPNVTLTIQPGVVVKFQEKSYNTSEQIYLEVRGKLHAKGTNLQPISFIPESAPTLGTDHIWQGILVKTALGGSIELDYFTLNNSYYGLSYDDVLLDTLTFNECKFSYNSYTLSVNTNFVLNKCEFYNNAIINSLMYVYGSVKAKDCIYKNNYFCMASVLNGVSLENCTFENTIASCFVQISGSFKNCTFKNNNTVFREIGTIEIDSCTFLNNEIAIDGASDGKIRNSIFKNNILALSVGANSIVEKNDISNNSVGLALIGKFTNGMVLPFIKENTICYNTLYNLENKSDYNLGLENNCFCLKDSLSIDQKIYDGYDDITRGLINFAVYDSLCLSIVQRVIKINLNTGVSIELKTLNLYPNPFTDKINLNVDDSNILWSVVDITGKTVYETTNHKNS
ncbi:MAG: hypothetical protein ACK45U_02225, partial [bacterium]